MESDPLARVRVLIVDRHEPTRLGLALILRTAPEIRRTLLAGGPGEALELVGRHRPDVALIDCSDGGFVALPLSRELYRLLPEVRILLTGHGTDPPRALVRGTRAAGSVPVDANAARTIELVLAAARGERSGQVRASRGALSPREMQVLALLVTGATNREIGSELHLGPDGVKKHASAIYRKLGVRNRTEAAQMFREEALGQAK